MTDESTQVPAVEAAGPHTESNTVAAPAESTSSGAAKPDPVSPIKRRRRILVAVLLGLLVVVAMAQVGVPIAVIVVLVLVAALVVGIVAAVRKARKTSKARRVQRDRTGGRDSGFGRGRAFGAGSRGRNNTAGVTPGGGNRGRGSGRGAAAGGKSATGAAGGAKPGAKQGRLARLRAALPGGKKNNAAAAGGKKTGAGTSKTGVLGARSGKPGGGKSGTGKSGTGKSAAGRFGRGKSGRAGGRQGLGAAGNAKPGSRRGGKFGVSGLGGRTHGGNKSRRRVRPNLAGAANGATKFGRFAGATAVGAARVTGWGWRGSARSGRWARAKASGARSRWNKHRAKRTGFVDAGFSASSQSHSGAYGSSPFTAKGSTGHHTSRPSMSQVSPPRYRHESMPMPSRKPPKQSRTFAMPTTPVSTTSHNPIPSGGKKMSHHATQGAVEAAGAMASYRPKNLLDIVNVSHSAPGAITAISQAFSNLAAGLEGTPAAAQADQYRQIAAQLAASASSAVETGAMLEAAHQTDLARIRNPRPGEHMADYSHNQS